MQEVKEEIDTLKLDYWKMEVTELNDMIDNMVLA